MQSAGPVIPFQHFNIIISGLIIKLLMNFRKTNSLHFSPDTNSDCHIPPVLHSPSRRTLLQNAFCRHRWPPRAFWLFTHHWAQQIVTLQLQSLPAVWMELNWTQSRCSWHDRHSRVFSLRTFISNFRDCFRRMWLRHRGRLVGCLSVSQIFSGASVFAPHQKLRRVLPIAFRRSSERDSRQHSLSDSYKHVYISVAIQSLLCLDLLIVEASHTHTQTHTHASLSVGLPWTSDQHDTQTSTSRHTIITKDRLT